MKLWALDYLACPRTGSRLELRQARLDPDQPDEILEGELVTPDRRVYPIIRGVPHLGLDPVSAAEAQTVAAFGAQWDEFDCLSGYMASRELFFSFFPTLAPADFPGRAVMEAGCGNGRWLLRMSELGARHVIGLDYSASVFNSWKNTKHLPNISIVRGSILQPPLRRTSLDLVVSMGVIHHLDDPALGLRELSRLLKTPAGRLAFWIYAKEGNESYLRLVEPLRRVTPYVPTRLLKAFSTLLATPVWLHAHTLNRWLGTRPDGAARLPLGAYFELLRRLRFQDVVNVVHDQLTPQLARYYTRQEVGQLLADAGLAEVARQTPRGNSWSLLTTTSGTAARDAA